MGAGTFNTRSYGYQPSSFAGAFDVEARASRLSYLASNTLWPLRPDANSKAAWLNNVNNTTVWSGSFEVEKRDSWVTRLSESDSDFDIDLEKQARRMTQWPGEAPPRRGSDATTDKPTPTGSDLVTPIILKYPFDGSGTQDDPYMVQWIENDPANPLEFAKGKKWLNAMVLALACFIVSVASSGFSSGMILPVE